MDLKGGVVCPEIDDVQAIILIIVTPSNNLILINHKINLLLTGFQKFFFEPQESVLWVVVVFFEVHVPQASGDNINYRHNIYY